LAVQEVLISTVAEETTKRRPRVIRLLTRLNVGGVSRHAAWLTAGLRHAGFDSVLVTGTVSPDEGDISDFAAEQGVKPIVIPELGRGISFQDLATLWKLYRLFVRQRPDLVHTHTAKAGALGRVAAFLYRWLTPGAFVGRPRRCRTVHTFHGHVLTGYFGPRTSRFFQWIERTLACLLTDRLLVLCPQQYRELHEQMGIGRPGHVLVVPLGIDLDQFAGAESRRHILRQEVGAGDDDILVGIVGRLTEIKNHRLFLQSAALWRKSFSAVGQRVHFLVIGDGHLRQELEEMVRTAGLTESILFLGIRHDMENVYPGLDVVALTSHNEGTPLSLIEAMANRRPVLSTDAGGVIDLLGDPRPDKEWPALSLCERGVLLQSREAETFCRGLALLVENAAVRKDLGERGRRFVERRYDKKQLIEAVAGVYAELLEDNAGTCRDTDQANDLWIKGRLVVENSAHSAAKAAAGSAR
jgi:glycosyltransferase involved in cell wall biosynthesis